MLEETALTPALALGLRDMLGTGIFSSEYLVASKRLGRADLTLGMGWGALPVETNFPTPWHSCSIAPAPARQQQAKGASRA